VSYTLDVWGLNRRTRPVCRLAELPGDGGGSEQLSRLIWKLLVEEVAARDGYRPCQRISAQSPPRFDTTTLGPIRPVLVTPNLYFNLSYPIFSPSS
jgi:hypothetical protein